MDECALGVAEFHFARQSLILDSAKSYILEAITGTDEIPVDTFPRPHRFCNEKAVSTPFNSFCVKVRERD